MQLTALMQMVQEVLGLSAAPWLDAVPDGQSYPAASYTFAGGAGAPTLSSAGVYRLRLQIDLHGKNAAELVGMRTRLIAALNGYQGTMSDGLQVLLIRFLAPVDRPYEGIGRLYRIGADFHVMFPL